MLEYTLVDKQTKTWLFHSREWKGCTKVKEEVGRGMIVIWNGKFHISEYCHFFRANHDICHIAICFSFWPVHLLNHWIELLVASLSEGSIMCSFQAQKFNSGFGFLVSAISTLLHASWWGERQRWHMESNEPSWQLVVILRNSNSLQAVSDWFTSVSVTERARHRVHLVFSC